MEVEFDSTKDQVNIVKHGISLALATEFDITTAITRLDNRQDYGETRYVALGYIAQRLYVLIFTMRQNRFRLISLRKANAREERDYEEETNY